MVGLVVVVSSIALAGVLLLLGREAGHYFYGLAALVALIEGITGGWTFLTRAGREEDVPDPVSAGAT